MTIIWSNLWPFCYFLLNCLTHFQCDTESAALCLTYVTLGSYFVFFYSCFCFVVFNYVLFHCFFSLLCAMWRSPLSKFQHIFFLYSFNAVVNLGAKDFCSPCKTTLPISVMLQVTFLFCRLNSNVSFSKHRYRYPLQREKWSYKEWKKVIIVFVLPGLPGVDPQVKLSRQRATCGLPACK